MTIEFTAHNIRLDDGTRTKPDSPVLMESHPWLLAAKRLLDTVFPGAKSGLRLVDLGCLEGGYSVEFARQGYQVLGIDVRQLNIDACNFVKARTSLPNLTFAKDNVLNVAGHGLFDVSFCCGLLYHLDRPREFLKTIGAVTRKALIVQTHFAPEGWVAGESLPWPLRRVVQNLLKVRGGKFNLSSDAENEALPGRWFREFSTQASFSRRETTKWAAWDNRRSFWLHRASLLQAIREAGFDLVLEQFDGLEPSISESMRRGYYRSDCRGTFIGIKL